jgi:hypothetical protein
MSNKVYQIDSWSIKIKELEYTKKTECFVTLLEEEWHSHKKYERREKISNNYFFSRKAAIEYLKKRCENKIEDLKSKLHQEKTKLGQIESMLKQETK